MGWWQVRPSSAQSPRMIHSPPAPSQRLFPCRERMSGTAGYVFHDPVISLQGATPLPPGVIQEGRSPSAVVRHGERD